MPILKGTLTSLKGTLTSLKGTLTSNRAVTGYLFAAGVVCVILIAVLIYLYTTSTTREQASLGVPVVFGCVMLLIGGMLCFRAGYDHSRSTTRPE